MFRSKTINLEKLKKDMDRWPKSWTGGREQNEKGEGLCSSAFSLNQFPDLSDPAW